MPGRLFHCAANGACFSAFAWTENLPLQRSQRRLQHAAEQPLSGRCPSSTAPIVARHKGGAAPQRPRLHLRRLHRQPSWMPRLRASAIIRPRTSRQAGRLGVQIGGAQIHQRLREIAWPRRPAPAPPPAARIAASPWASACRPHDSRAITRSALASIAACRLVIGDGRDRRRRIGADARQRAQALPSLAGNCPP